LADFGRSHKPPRADDDTARGLQAGERRRAAARGGSRLQEAPELLRARGVPELPERLGLDLTDALTGHGEVLTDLLQRVLAPVGQAEAEAQDLLLARREGSQHLVGLLAKREPDDRLHGGDDLLVLDEIAEVAVLFLADRRLEADRLLVYLQDLAYLLDRHVHLRGDLFGRGLASELLDELPRRPDELVDRLDHVHRDADGAGLVGDGAGNRLADPPGGVGGELVAAPVLELVDGLHQADVPFLDQVEELEAPVRVLLGDGDDESEVGLHHLLLRLGGLLLALADDVDDPLELVDAGLGLLLDALGLPLGVALPP